MPVSEKLEDHLPFVQRAGGKSPLRLIAKRTWHSQDCFTDTLECGHESSLQFTSFGYVEDQYIHRIAPTAKRRRCQQCKTSAVCAVPIVRHLRLPEKNPPVQPVAVPIVQKNPPVQPVFNLYVTAAAEIALPPKKPSHSVQQEKWKAA
jgi:hypothetical protein